MEIQQYIQMNKLKLSRENEYSETTSRFLEKIFEFIMQIGKAIQKEENAMELDKNLRLARTFW